MYIVNMDAFFVFVFSCLFASGLSLPSLKPIFRLDYVYNQKTDAFYKLHTEPQSRLEAEAACKAEGAKLMVSSYENDITQVYALMMHHGIDNAVWIGEEENNLMCPAITKNMKVSPIECTAQLPFACKVTYADASYVEECQAYGYRYYSETGSCYRVPPYATTWDNALIDCQKENAHLVVLNSEEETKIIKAFLKTVPSVPNSFYKEYFFAGFKADKPSRVFRTIFGKTLEENGYVGWSNGEPNNGYEKTEYCGSVYQETGMNNDIRCTIKYGFICEKLAQVVTK